MRHIQLIKILSSLILVLIIATFISSCCNNEVHGTFYISEQARKYMPDTTIQSFEMIDQNGITEGFYINDRHWYSTHLYMSQWGEPNRCGDGFATEDFGIAYSSTMNDYFLMITLRSDTDGTELELEWNQIDRVTYNIDKNEITSDQKPSIEFISSIVIDDFKYDDVILFDFQEITNEININTPQKIYIAANYGLIKYELQNGIISERKRAYED